MKRDDLLKYKNKSNSFGLLDNRTFIFKTKFDNSLPETHKCIKRPIKKFLMKRETF